MSTKSLTLAKSLHTVSVLVSVSEFIRSYVSPQYPDRTSAEYVKAALNVLGYTDATDPYGLAARAVAILESGK